MGLSAPGSLEPPASKPFSQNWSPLLRTTIPRHHLLDLQMNTDRNRADGTTQRGMESMDHHETRTIANLTITGSPDRDTGVDLQDRTKRDGEAAPTVRAVRGWSRTKKRIALLVAVLVVCVTAALYYLLFIAPFESTDDAFIEGHVTQVAPQVAGRVARVLVNDNQFVNAGEVLGQIEPSDYEATLQKERANLASAQSRLVTAVAQLTVDQAKAGQERANVTAAQAEATRAETDSNRYEAIGTSSVSQSQIELAATQARSPDATLTAVTNQELAAAAPV